MAAPRPSPPPAVTTALAARLQRQLDVPTLANHGSVGLRLDVALDLSTPDHPLSGGVLVDFPQDARTGDAVSWDLFRSDMLAAAGWELRHAWSTDLFRRHDATVAALVDAFKAQ